MLPLLGFKELLFLGLRDFLRNPNNMEAFPFMVKDLLQKWTAGKDELKKHFNDLLTDDWLKNTILFQKKTLQKTSL